MEIRTELRRLSEQQYGVISRCQAQQIGVGKSELRWMLDSGIWAATTPAVLELVGTPQSDEKRVMSAVLDAPQGAVVSHGTAAAWWRIPGFSYARRQDVTIPRQGVRGRTRLAVLHFQKDLPMDQVHWMNSVPVESPALTIFHLAGTAHPAKVERALDNAWAMRLLDGRKLSALLDRLAARGRNGIRLMRELIVVRGEDYVPPESGNEARFLHLLERAGLPSPRRQVRLGGDQFIGRVDFLYEDEGLVVEILSRRYHASLLDRGADTRRFDELRSLGFSVMAIWDEEIWQEPSSVVERIRTSLRDTRSTQPFSRGKGGL
jgi:very-short-patch-repair endonuclease